MATYYKYAERGADSQVNWADVGKGISDMLSEEVKIREEKKAAYEKAYQDDMKNLSDNPQGGGIWGGNDTINNFAHDMMEQKKIDYDLLKSGRMKPRDYTLRSNNYNSQTDTLFEVAKTLISTREQRIKEFQEGKILAINMSNLNDAAAFTDFSNAKIIIDGYSANLNMGIYEMKTIDGKNVPVLKKNMTANQLKAAVGTITPTVDVSAQVANGAKSLGALAIDIVKLPDSTVWGDIKTLTGVESLIQAWNSNENGLQKSNPGLGDVIKKIESAIDSKIDSIIPLGSAQTSAFEKYLGTSASDYTSSVEEAKNKPTKVLKYIDPQIGWTIDPNGPNYKKQVEELKGEMKKDLYAQLDNITKESVIQQRTAAATSGSMSAAALKDRNDREEAKVFAGLVDNLITGKDIDQNLQALASKAKVVASHKNGVYTIQVPSKINNFTGKTEKFPPYIINTQKMSEGEAARKLTTAFNGVEGNIPDYMIYENLNKSGRVIPEDLNNSNLINPFFPNTQTGISPITNTTPKSPKVGTVEDGYKFKGGDAADPKNWEKVK